MPESFYIQYCNTDPFPGKRLAERYRNEVYVVQNPPAKPLTQEEMDEVYASALYADLSSFLRKDSAGVPAISEIKFSSGQQPGLFRRLQLLRPDLSSGTDHPDQKP